MIVISYFNWWGNENSGIRFTVVHLEHLPDQSQVLSFWLFSLESEWLCPYLNGMADEEHSVGRNTKWIKN